MLQVKLIAQKNYLKFKSLLRLIIIIIYISSVYVEGGNTGVRIFPLSPHCYALQIYIIAGFFGIIFY